MFLFRMPLNSVAPLGNHGKIRVSHSLREGLLLFQGLLTLEYWHFKVLSRVIWFRIMAVGAHFLLPNALKSKNRVYVYLPAILIFHPYFQQCLLKRRRSLTLRWTNSTLTLDFFVMTMMHLVTLCIFCRIPAKKPLSENVQESFIDFKRRQRGCKWLSHRQIRPRACSREFCSQAQFRVTPSPKKFIRKLNV